MSVVGIFESKWKFLCYTVTLVIIMRSFIIRNSCILIYMKYLNLFRLWIFVWIIGLSVSDKIISGKSRDWVISIPRYWIDDRWKWKLPLFVLCSKVKVKLFSFHAYIFIYSYHFSLNISDPVILMFIQYFPYIQIWVYYT